MRVLQLVAAVSMVLVCATSADAGTFDDPVVTIPLPDTGGGAPAADAGPAAMPQQAMLSHQDRTGSTIIQANGNAAWHLERVSGAAGEAPETLVRGNVEIPDQKLSVRISVRHNDDSRMPASHILELFFALPPDFPHGGIKTIPGILAKPDENSRGSGLVGSAVRVTDGFFLVGLSSADVNGNTALLKGRSWLDIPIVFGDGARAVLAVEKGDAGERVLAEAFAAWAQTVPPSAGQPHP